MPEPKKPSFRKQPVPTPAPPAAAAAATIPTRAAPGGGKLPMQDILLSTGDKEQLREIGWKEGDHIPPNFAKQIKAAQLRSTADTSAARADLIEQGKQAGGRAKVGKELNLSELPEAEQEELRKALADYQQTVAEDLAQQARAQEQEAQVVQNAEPSVQAAHRATIAAETQPGLPEVEIRPPTPAPTAADFPPQLRPRKGAVIAGVENIAPFVTDPHALHPKGVDHEQVQQEMAAEPRPAVAPEDQTVDAGGAPAPTHCPRCMWDVRAVWELEVEDADKELFIAAVWGGTRFTKTIAVMGGHIQITYRSLTSQETDLCFKQLGMDLRQGKLFDDAQYFMQLQTYRLSMSVERIDTGNNECLAEVPPVFEIDYDPPVAGEPDATQLIPMVQWFNEEIASQESLRRIVAQHHRQFQRLVEALEAMASEPDFWKGIKSPT